MALYKDNPLVKKNFNLLSPQIDSGSLSEGVFNVKELPTTFTLGYNSFKINPNRELFRANSIVDFYVSSFIDGRPVRVGFPEVDFGNGDILLNVKFDDSYVVDSYKIQLLGELKEGGFVMWEKELILDKSIANSSPILFEQTPSIRTIEVTKNALEEVYAEGGSTALFVTQSNYGAIESDKILNTSASVNLDVRSDGDSFVLGNSLNFTQSMAEAGYVRLTVPSQSLPLFSKFYSLTGSNQITSSIVDFLGIKALKIKSLTRPISNLDVPHKYFSFKNANFEIIYPKTITTQEVTGTTQKYFRFEFIRLQPISGQVHSVKIEYQKQVEANPQLLTISELRSNEFLIDTGSLSLNYKIGLFDTGSKATTYWQTFFRKSAGFVSASSLTWNEVSESYGKSTILFQQGSPEITLDDVTTFDFTSTIGNSVVVGNDLIDYSNPESYIEFSPVTSSFTTSGGVQKYSRYFNFYYKEIPYVLSFDAFVETNLGSNFKNPLMKVYMDGFGFRKVGGDSFGSLLGVLDSDSSQKTFQRQSFVFTPYSNGIGYPRFIVNFGKWYLKNISIRAYQEKGLTPGHTYLYVPVPSTLSDTSVDMTIDFLNELNSGITLI